MQPSILATPMDEPWSMDISNFTLPLERPAPAVTGDVMVNQERRGSLTSLHTLLTLSLQRQGCRINILLRFLLT